MEPDFKNPNREPVISLSDLADLDPEEMAEGANDGREGFPCSDNRSRSYWHGWRQAARDYGHRQGDMWDAMLTKTVCPGGAGIMTLSARVDDLRKLKQEIGLRQRA